MPYTDVRPVVVMAILHIIDSTVDKSISINNAESVMMTDDSNVLAMFLYALHYMLYNELASKNTDLLCIFITSTANMRRD